MNVIRNVHSATLVTGHQGLVQLVGPIAGVTLVRIHVTIRVSDAMLQPANANTVPRVSTVKDATSSVTIVDKACVIEISENVHMVVMMGGMERSVNCHVPKTAESVTRMTVDA